MSWAEINQNKGMPYGGMPADAILMKLEATDPGLVNWAAPRRPGRPGEGFTGIEHKDYMISEILDRTPDQGFLESDRPRRNPQVAREALNLRYNGTRGTVGEYPRHPDLFLGFTGNDPRGADNTPRFDQMREQLAHRARQAEVLMGDSVGHDGGELDGQPEAAHQVAERPWTGVELQRARIEGHIQNRRRLKIFSTTKDGRSTGKNVASHQRAARAGKAVREALAFDGTERWREGGGPSRTDARSFERVGFTASGRDPRAGDSVAAARKRPLATAEFEVARYGRAAKGRTRGPGSEAAAAERDASQQQQALQVARGGRSTGAHRALAITMAEGAQARRAAASRDASGDDAARGAPADGQTTEAVSGRGRALHASEVDVAAAYFQGTEDQSRGVARHGRAALPGGALAFGATAALSGATQQVVHESQADHSRPALAMSVAAAARRAASHQAEDGADLVKAAYYAAADGSRPSPVGSSDAAGSRRALGRGVTPEGNSAAGGGNDSAKRQVKWTVGGPAAARNLEVANYKGARPTVKDTSLGGRTAALGGAPLAAAAAARHLQGTNTTQKRPEFRGQTQASLGVVTEDEGFGLHVGAVDEAARAPGHRLGLKSARYDRLARAAGDRLGDERMEFAIESY